MKIAHITSGSPQGGSFKGAYILHKFFYRKNLWLPIGHNRYLEMMKKMEKISIMMCIAYRKKVANDKIYNKILF